VVRRSADPVAAAGKSRARGCLAPHMDDIDLRGRTALVTGSTQGIGHAIAAGLAGAGAHVVVNGRDEKRVDDAAAHLRETVPGADVTGIAADVASDDGAAALVAAPPLVGDDLPWDEAQRRFVREYRPQSLLQRLIEPVEIANMVTYLASDLASATTGGALRVDGEYVDGILP
jgi:NAD(P)-dependent dehydrogenase (short-subunit alcohol dehydrogenase family)